MIWNIFYLYNKSETFAGQATELSFFRNLSENLC